MSTTIADRGVALQMKPFRHVIVDDWAEPELVRAAEAEWPDETWPFWHRYENGKLATKDPLRHPPACAELIRRMLCLPVSELLGIDGTFGDWHCHGGGLHSMPPGSSLGLHLDSDHHPLTGWVRACNAVLSVNSVWDEHCGGEFELWDARGDQCVKRIAPRFNRLVLFEPSDVSWHSVAPVRGEESRKTLAVFFWKQGTSQRRRSQARFMGEMNG
jgi:hypothetical protein